MPQKTRMLEPSPAEQDIVVMYSQKYELLRITRSVQMKLDKVGERLEAAREANDLEKLVAGMIDGIDSMLKPLGEHKPAKVVLAKAWKDDLLSIDELANMLANLQTDPADPT